jgi:hypothetical protein
MSATTTESDAAVPSVPVGGGRLAPMATATIVGIGVAYVAVVNPERPGHYPLCVFHSMTGLWCPGCGSLRAVHALTRGDLTTALHRNALLVLAAPLLALAWTQWMRGTLSTRARAPHRISRVAWWSLAAVLLAFGVARNVPFGHALAP